MDDAEECTRVLLREEVETYEELQNCLRRISTEFEACQKDTQLTGLVEEKHTLLLNVMHDCGDSIDELQDDRNKIKHRCETDIEGLKREQQMLEAMPL